MSPFQQKKITQILMLLQGRANKLDSTYLTAKASSKLIMNEMKKHYEITYETVEETYAKLYATRI